MEVVKRYYRERALPAWMAFANALAAFLDEAAFRSVLAFDVIVGSMLRRVKRRWGNRSTETPVLIDVCDWTDERRIFSVLVWPSLESGPRDAAYAHRRRVEEVEKAIAKGAAEMAWSTRFETDHGLRWDRGRELWTSSTDGFAYDGSDSGNLLEASRDAT